MSQWLMLLTPPSGLSSALLLLLPLVACSGQKEPSSAGTKNSVSATVDQAPATGPVLSQPSPDAMQNVKFLPAEAREFFFELKQQLFTLKGMDSVPSLLERIPAEIAEATPSGEGFSLQLAQAVSVRDLCDWLGWTRPYGVSGDVHQRSFSVRLYEKELDDPHGRRIATLRPQVGNWLLDAELEQRPPGPLPKISAGASPAYPLERSSVRVVRIRVEWQPAP